MQPCADGFSEGEIDGNDPSPRPRGRAAPSILIVDPSEATRRAVAEVLRECGYVVHCAEGLREGERACQTLREGPRLALLEFRLGDGSGDQLAMLLRTRWPECFMVYFSGSHPSYDEALREALLAPRTGFLAKPTSLDAVVETVQLRVQS